MDAVKSYSEFFHPPPFKRNGPWHPSLLIMINNQKKFTVHCLFQSWSSRRRPLLVILKCPLERAGGPTTQPKVR